MDEVLKPIAHLGIGSYIDDSFVIPEIFNDHEYAIDCLF